VCASILKELKTPHLNPDFGLIKKIRAIIRKFFGSQIQAGDYPSLKFIFFKSQKWTSLNYSVRNNAMTSHVREYDFDGGGGHLIPA
jgi:hypothetical protein